MTLDPKSYLAVVKMQIDSAVKLTKDTAAAVSSSGLLGDKFMSLTPGNDDAMIAPGGVITATQSSVSLENLIGQFLYSSSKGTPAAAK